jgi:hypothetical protein
VRQSRGALAGDGWEVVVGARSPEQVEAVAEEIGGEWVQRCSQRPPRLLTGAVSGRLASQRGPVLGEGVFRLSICLSRAREYQILHNRAAVTVSGQRLA